MKFHLFSNARTNCFCASLLRTQIYSPRHGWERALSNKMNKDRVDGPCYSFVWDLTILDVRLPLFFFWWIIFSTDFLRLAKKMKKIYRLELWIFCKMHHRFPFFLALRLSVRRFQMPLEWLSFAKTLVTLEIIYPTDSLLRNMTKIVCLRWLTCNIFNYKPL